MAISVVVVVVLMVAVLVILVVLMVESVETVVDSRPEFTLLSIVNKTKMNKPIARSALRTGKRENGLNLHLLCFRVDACPSLGGLTG